jgi:predicted AlkP superfamily pyrophosphatase or phosphodiesterase
VAIIYGLADLSNSVFAGLKLPSTVDSLNLGESSGREVLLLIDGLGQQALNTYASQFDNFNLLKQVAVLNANFPSTTATSLTTVGTGLLPGVHGMLGYTVKIPRSDNRILNALKWDDRVDPIHWQKNPTLFERANRFGIKTFHVAAKRYENTGFTQAALRGATYVGANQLDQMASAVADCLREPAAFVYTYLNIVDMAGHNDGVGSEKWLLALEQTFSFMAMLVSLVPKDTRIWITSDHGMINRDEQIILGQDNKLLQDVELLAGEPRARHIYVKAGAIAEVKSIWEESLKNKATILDKEMAINAGYFGKVVSPDSYERLGDLIAIANENLILVDPQRVKEESGMVGHHGGTTAAEIEIPLLKVQLD